MLKVDFHLHSHEDPLDWPMVKHSAFQLIDHAAKFKFDVLALTLHEKIYFPKALQDYAKKRNILLIPGMEATVEGKHVLLINPPLNTQNPGTFEKLEKAKEEGAFTIAAHPYYLRSYCLGNLLKEHIKLFDAIEHCHFYTPYLNRNKKAIAVAEEYNKPMIANSDTHFFHQFNTNYTFVDAEKKTDDVLEAIRKNKIKLGTRPLSTLEFSRIFAKIMMGNVNPTLLLNKRKWRQEHPLQ